MKDFDEITYDGLPRDAGGMGVKSLVLDTVESLFRMPQNEVRVRSEMITNEP